MGRDAYALLTGLFVIILGSVLILMAYWLGQYGNHHDSYQIVTQNAVSGLKPESTVYYRGVEAGKVAGMAFDSHDPRTIRVRIQIRKGVPITNATFARLRVQPLTGLAQIELDNPGGEAQPLPTSEDKPAEIPMRPSLMEQLTNSGQDLLGQANQLLVSLNALLKEENRSHLEHILGNIETATARLVTLEQRLDQALASLPPVSSDVRRSLGHMNELTVNLKDTSHSFGAVGNKLEQTTLPRVNAALEELQRAAAQLKQLSGQLHNNPQALLLGPAAPLPGPGEPGYQESR